MQSEVILLSNVKQDNLAELMQKQFRLFGIANVRGKRIDADEEAIARHIAESLSEYNIIVVIGGFGEQDNHMTVRAVSETVGFQTVMKDGELFPKGAEILKNKEGKPSGCVIAQGNQCIMMLPGDQDTIQYLLCYRASRYIANFISQNSVIRTVRAADITKPEADDAVADAAKYGCNAMVYEDGGEIAVSVYSNGASYEEAKARNSSEVKNLIAALGSSVYAIDAENIGQALGQELKKKDLSISVAAEGVDENEIKAYSFAGEYGDRFLGVSGGLDQYEIPAQALSHHGCNSDWAAAFLAGETAKKNGSNLGIAVTENPARRSEGANIAVSLGDNVWTEKVMAGDGENLAEVAVSKALHLARKVVSAYPKAFAGASSLKNAVAGKEKLNTATEAPAKKKWYSRFIPMRGDSKGELIRKIVFLVCVVVFLGSMGYLSTKVVDSQQQKKRASDLQSLLNVEAPEDWQYLPSLYALYQENNDTIGYIKIDGTNVDYPVVQTVKAGDKGETGQFYLRKDFYGNYSMYGTPFLDYRCSVNPNYETNNLLIYGHNIYDDGQMFANLIKYRQLKYYREHPLVQFDTLYGEGDYLIIGVIMANAYAKDGPVWDYNNFIDGDEKETKEFMSEIAARTMIVTGIDYNKDDTFLTLSTCCYDFKDARQVIVARKVREGEDVSNIDTSKSYYNANPLMPDKWYQALAEKQKAEEDAAFGAAETIPDINGDIEKIAVTTLPTKVVYKNGEKLDLTGIVVTIAVRGEDGEREYRELSLEECIAMGIISKEEIENVVIEGMAPGTTTNIVFEYNGIEFSIPISIESDQPSSSSAPESSASESSSSVSAVTSVATKLPDYTYEQGNQFQYDQITIVVDGREMKLSEAAPEDLELTMDGEKLGDKTVFSAAGEKTVKGKYKGVEFSFKINVKAPSSVSSEPASSESSSSISSGSTEDPGEGTGEGGGTGGGEGTEGGEGTGEGEGSGGEATGTDAGMQALFTGAAGKVTLKKKTVKTSEPAVAAMTAPAAASVTSGGTSPYYEQSLEDTIKVNGNTMSMYEAVCRVVQIEAGNNVEEYVKAQTVASYTYLKHYQTSGQTLSGVLMSSWSSVTAKTKRIVSEMIGYAVLDDRSNNYILAVYFTTSPGCTADAEWVWGYSNRNLVSVSGSPEEIKTYTYRISSSDFKSKMGTAYDLSGDPSTWIQIKSYYGSTPYIEYLSIGGQTVKARKLREGILGNANLRSTAFTVSYDRGSDQLVFVASGYGHGVGMSAQGAIAYANRGYTFDQILLSYYSNCYVGMKY